MGRGGVESSKWRLLQVFEYVLEEQAIDVYLTFFFSSLSFLFFFSFFGWN